MAKLLILLGAGASKPTGTPLMDDFLDRVHELGAGETNHFKTVIDLVADLEILHSRSAVTLRNIESVFNLVEMGQLVGRLPNRDQAAIQDAAVAMRKVVAETLERTCKYPIIDGDWRPPEPYESFAKFLESRNSTGRQLSVSLVTFNYDVALDYALMYSGVRHHYGFPGEPDTTGIPLLKLHGSLNWGLCECGEVRAIPLREIIAQARIALARHHTGAVTFQVSKHLGQFKHCNGHSLTGPAIVPPSWNKAQYWRSFTHIWNRAADELASAENILVAGYSLPQTDSFFRDLFALGMASRTRIKRFIVANPDRNLEGRFGDLLGPTVRDVYEFWGERFEDVVRKLPQIDW